MKTRGCGLETNHHKESMSRKKEIQDFVLLSHARCGSNMLRTMLDEHPQITCFGEIFNPSYAKGYIKWVKSSFLRRFSHKYLREYCTKTYLDGIRTGHTQPGTRAVGYKIMYPGQFERYSNFRNYWKSHEYKIIRLTRKNLLRRYVSGKIANKENRWSASSYRGRLITVAVDLDDLMHSINRLESIDSQIDALAREFQHLMVNHEQLVSDRKNSLQSIFKFLNVDIDEAENIQPRTVKQNPAKLNRLIENYDEVRKALKETQYKCFLEESS